jgi:thiamine phosphate synthase YjbQ (UPF0047 family)
MNYQQQITVTTSGSGDMHNLTEQVATIVASSKIQTGTVNVFNVGSTAAVGTIEFEPGLQHDLPDILNKLIPPAAPMAMSKPGTMATAIRTCRQHYSDRRSPSPFLMASSASAPGSKSSI